MEQSQARRMVGPRQALIGRPCFSGGLAPAAPYSKWRVAQAVPSMAPYSDWRVALAAHSRADYPCPHSDKKGYPPATSCNLLKLVLPASDTLSRLQVPLGGFSSSCLCRKGGLIKAVGQALEKIFYGHERSLIKDV